MASRSSLHDVSRQTISALWPPSAPSSKHTRLTDANKVERAIQLSTEKYCGAFGTLSASAEMTWDYEVLAPEDIGGDKEEKDSTSS